MAGRRSSIIWARARRAMLAILFVLFSLGAGGGAAASTETPQLRAPADAPLVGRQLALPEVPRGYEVRDAGWLKLAFPPELAKWAQPLVTEAEAFKAVAIHRLGKPVLQSVHVRLAADPNEMKRLAPKGAPYPAYAAGVAYSSLGLILLTDEPVHPGDAHELRTTFRHELAHVALRDALGDNRVPLWFNEGLAIHLSRENTFARTRSLWAASVSGNLLPLADLDRRFPSDIVGVPLAYAQSADVVRFLLRTADQERFRLLIQRVGRGQAFDRALYDSYTLDTYNLERTWRDDLSERFSFWPALFGGTMIWTLAVVLVTLAWRRKRTKQRATMARWAKEEAIEDARAARLLQKPDAAHWAGSDVPPAMPVAAQRSSVAQGRRDSIVPKVEHDGNWHTLH